MTIISQLPPAQSSLAATNTDTDVLSSSCNAGIQQSGRRCAPLSSSTFTATTEPDTTARATAAAAMSSETADGMHSVSDADSGRWRNCARAEAGSASIQKDIDSTWTISRRKYASSGTTRCGAVASSQRVACSSRANADISTNAKTTVVRKCFVSEPRARH
jgi:hypothetical protein